MAKPSTNMVSVSSAKRNFTITHSPDGTDLTRAGLVRDRLGRVDFHAIVKDHVGRATGERARFPWRLPTSTELRASSEKSFRQAGRKCGLPNRNKRVSRSETQFRAAPGPKKRQNRMLPFLVGDRPWWMSKPAEATFKTNWIKPHPTRARRMKAHVPPPLPSG